MKFGYSGLTNISLETVIFDPKEMLGIKISLETVIFDPKEMLDIKERKGRNKG